MSIHQLRDRLRRQAREAIDGRANFEATYWKSTKPLRRIELDPHDLLTLLDYDDVPVRTHPPSNLPEPFSRSAETFAAHVSVAQVQSVEDAFNAGRAPYGDEGEGYDLDLATAVLIYMGWTPPKEA